MVITPRSPLQEICFEWIFILTSSGILTTRLIGLESSSLPITVSPAGGSKGLLGETVKTHSVFFAKHSNLILKGNQLVFLALEFQVKRIEKFTFPFAIVLQYRERNSLLFAKVTVIGTYGCTFGLIHQEKNMSSVNEKGRK